MSNEENAWAAGLFDGEGTVGLVYRGARQLPRIFFALVMTDLDVVERFALWCGGVRVAPRKISNRPQHHKPQFYVQINDWRLIETLYIRMKPWLGQRRRAAFEASIEAMRAKGDNPRWRHPDGSCLQCGSSITASRGGCPDCRRARTTRYNHKVRSPRSDRQTKECQ